MNIHILRVALLAAAALIAAPAAAQTSTTPAYQQASSVNLYERDTRWRADESWNDDNLVYEFSRDGTFVSPSGAGGRWVQTGNRVILDWPSYGATYIGTMSGNSIGGVARLDNGEAIGTFVLTRER
ncbi:MAG: hypothetical protein ABL932_24190 [Terricaulis sp.]